MADALDDVRLGAAAGAEQRRVGAGQTLKRMKVMPLTTQSSSRVHNSLGDEEDYGKMIKK